MWSRAQDSNLAQSLCMRSNSYLRTRDNNVTAEIQSEEDETFTVARVRGFKPQRCLTPNVKLVA